MSYSSRHIENCILILLDTTAALNDDNHETIVKLQHIVHCLEPFSSSDDCMQYILNLEDTQVILIISSTANDEILSHFNELPQIHSIYILIKGNEQQDNQWADSMKKIKKISASIEDICEQIPLDIIRLEQDLIQFNIIGKTNNDCNDEQEGTFIQTHLIKETLLKTTDGSEHDIAEFCRHYYANNTTELTNINEFQQTYKEHSPVWWYTRLNFLRRVLNKALRDRHVETLYIFRCFIRKLHEQLGNMSSNNNEQNFITVYRIQTILDSQFDLLKANEGGLVSISNLLSTTSDMDTSIMFTDHTEERKSILIIIHVDLLRRDNVFCADISSVSFSNNKKKEWLFSMGSVFRIGSIEKNKDYIWSINLTLVDDQDSQLVALTEHMRETIQDSNPLLQLGRLMLQMDQPMRVEHFYQAILKNVTDWKQHAILLQHLGTLYDTQNKLDKALDHFHQSLEIYLKHISDDDPVLAWIYDNIGLIYNKHQNYDLSLNYLNHALHIHLTMSQANQENIVRCYNNIASVYTDQEKYTDALINYRHALDFQLKKVPSLHPLIAVAYSNIAYILYCLNRFDEAVEYQENALDIDLISLPTEHIQTKQHNHLLNSYRKLAQSRSTND